MIIILIITTEQQKGGGETRDITPARLDIRVGKVQSVKSVSHPSESLLFVCFRSLCCSLYED